MRLAHTGRRLAPVAAGLVLLGALVLLVALPGAAIAAPGSSSYSSTIADAQAAAQELLTATGAPSMSVAIMSGDRLVWTQGFGYADVSAKTAPTATTMYGIGSVSKMLAAVAVMRLVDQGRLSLDAPVVKYLPTFTMASPDYKKITVRMLLDHSSGMPGTEYANSFTSPDYYPGFLDEMMQTLSMSHLKAKPGAWSAYCNDGFTLVEKLVPAVTGMSFAEYVSKQITKPLGMAHTTFPLYAFADGSYAKAYNGDQARPREACTTLAAGAAYSTVVDLGRFGAMLAGYGSYGGVRILSTRAVEQMGTDQTLGQFDPAPTEKFRFGLGWDTMSEPGLKQVGVVGWCKGGDTTDYHSALLVAPEQRLVVSVTGVTPLSSSTLDEYAQLVMLRALLENGSIKSLPAELHESTQPVRATERQLAQMEGYWAGSQTILRIKRSPADPQRLVISALNGDAWTDLSATMSLRSDGYFHSGTSTTRYRVTAGGGNLYLVFNTLSMSGTYHDQQLYSQKLVPGRPLSAAWRTRAGNAWLAVNQQPSSSLWQTAAGPLLMVDAIPGMPGFVSVRTSDYPLQPVRPLSDSLAGMCLAIPGFGSVDLEDLAVLPRGGEDWVRFGFTVYRPVASVLALHSGVNSVTFGREGYAEWRTAAPGSTIRIHSGRAWRLYDAELDPVADGTGFPAAATVPAGGGYLLLFGRAGSTTRVTQTGPAGAAPFGANIAAAPRAAAAAPTSLDDLLGGMLLK